MGCRKMATTRAAINKPDNDLLVSWSRQATVEEKKPVFVADIMKRLIERHVKENGNAVPKPVSDNCESASDES